MKLPWKYILISLAVGLLLGAAAGLFCCRGLARHWITKSPEMFLKRLDHELHLTEPQKTQIHALLIAKRDKMAVYEDELRKAARADIRTALSPDQQTRFDMMMARHDAKRHKRENQ